MPLIHIHAHTKPHPMKTTAKMLIHRFLPLLVVTGKICLSICYDSICPSPTCVTDVLTIDQASCETIQNVKDAMSGENITPYARYLLEQQKDYTAIFWSWAAKDLLLDMLHSRTESPMTEYDELPRKCIYIRCYVCSQSP